MVEDVECSTDSSKTLHNNNKNSFDKDENEETSSRDFEIVMETSVGNFGVFQAWLAFCLFVCTAAMAPGIYGSVFTDYTPKHHCSQGSEDVFNMSIWNNEELRCPSDNSSDCSSWAYDTSVYTNTASSEFNVICSIAYLKTLSGTLRMAGLLVGSSFFGWLSDRFGRVPSLFSAAITLTVSMFINGFSQNYITFSILNFVMAAGGIGLYLVGFVLMFEWILPLYRTKVGALAQVPFAVGFLYLVLISWAVRSDWRTLQWVLAAPNLMFLSIPWIIPESPRWLMSHGRNAKATKVINRAARLNGLPVSNLLPENMSSDNNQGVSALIFNKTLLVRLILMSFNWLVITLCFYGLSLNSANTGDLFLSMAAMAAVEIPAYLAALVLMELTGRRNILFFCQLLAGLSCIGAGFIPVQFYYPKLILSLSGKMGASAGFAVVFVYTAELFHTSVRNSAVGLCSMVARIGALLAPTIAGLDSVLSVLPFLIMGGVSIMAGCAAFFLPETRGMQLPETLEEAKSLGHKKISRI